MTDFSQEDQAFLRDSFQLPLDKQAHIAYLEVHTSFNDSTATMVFDTEAAHLDAFFAALSETYRPASANPTAEDPYRGVEWERSDGKGRLCRDFVLKGRMQWTYTMYRPEQDIYDLLMEKGEEPGT